MALDRRKVIHRGTSNVLATLSVTQDAIDAQATSGDLSGWPDAAADVTSIQSFLTTHHSALESWYVAWRGREAPEPPSPDFLGVFGTATAYETNLKDSGDIPRLVRNNYSAMSMIAMAYEELYSTALALEATAPGLKEITMNGLEAIIPIIVSLSETMCTVAIRALHNEDSTIPMSIATTAIANTQSAWDA